MLPLKGLKNEEEEPIKTRGVGEDGIGGELVMMSRFSSSGSFLMLVDVVVVEEGFDDDDDDEVNCDK